MEVLTGLKEHGLSETPKLATGDGSLGFWQALAKVFPLNRKHRSSRAHDDQSAGQTARHTAAGGQGDAARDLEGRHAAPGDSGLQTVHLSEW